jgi:hypothetical protein
MIYKIKMDLGGIVKGPVLNLPLQFLLVQTSSFPFNLYKSN